MNEFKFNCPNCSQRILANTEWSGRQINCPSCKTSLTIPAKTNVAKRITQIIQPEITPLPKTSKPEAALTSSVRSSKPSDKPSPSVTPETKKKTAPLPSVRKEELRTAVLTPAVKLEIVRAVHKRIADKSTWLPGKLKQTNAYAAKLSNGQPVLVDVTSPDAVRFSLIGAFLLELHLRRVVRTAVGRTRLLDQEIPDAVREALLQEMSEEAREQVDDPLATTDLLSISHAECLAALDIMEERYAQKKEANRIESAKRNLGDTRLSDLVNKLEKKGRITPEDVAVALYHELTEVRRQLDRMERKIATSTKAAPIKVS